MIKRISVLALGALLGTWASAQSLDDRVRELERRVEQLEKQLAPSASSSSAKPATGQADGWQKKENWRALKHGMSEDEVRSLLGEPDKVNAFATFWVWLYPGDARVQIDKRSGAVSWSDPH